MVIDVGRWELSRFVLPGGQSGNPFSRHYADQLGLWQRGDAFPIAWSEHDVRRSTRSTLRLHPAG
jgi:penicillin amidase